jgi:hypothetical protein
LDGWLDNRADARRRDVWALSEVVYEVTDCTKPFEAFNVLFVSFTCKNQISQQNVRDM